MTENIIVVVSNKHYRITVEGSRSDIYDFGTWFTKLSGYCPGPVWSLERRTYLFGWLLKSTTNSPSIVLKWKKEYFSGKKDKI